ncbi:MAG TPA: serine hydrolase domain-containing protein [Acidobacteriota bacterium]|nr:serine hydrolase domain-containing protein [Acidobacteriota bacterium]
MQKLIPLLMLILAATYVAADAIDDFVTARMKETKTPGLSLAIVQNGEVVRAKGYGYANIELKAPATEETVYQSGSVGKQFTATAIMMLRDEGKLSLQDHITKYFPDAPDTWKDITIRNLLTHTSGLKEYTDMDLQKDRTEKDLEAFVEKPPLDFPTNSKFEYSNTNYLLLGYIIEKVTGKFYGDFLKERIWDPLGMTSTRVISESAIIPNRAAGYELDKNGNLMNQTWVAPTINTTADGALYFSVLDLAKWDAALYTEKVLKRSSLQEMWTGTPQSMADYDGGYGYGWSMGYQRGHRIIQHGGSWQGFRSQISRYVDDKLTVIVLLNQAWASPGSIAHTVAGLYNDALLTPDRMKTKTDPDPVTTQGLRQMLPGIAQPQPADAKVVSSSFEAALSKDWRKTYSDSTQKMQSLTFIDCDIQDAGTKSPTGDPVDKLCYYKITTDKEPIYCTAWITSQGKVSYLQFQ